MLHNLHRIRDLYCILFFAIITMSLVLVPRPVAAGVFMGLHPEEQYVIMVLTICRVIKGQLCINPRGMMTGNECAHARPYAANVAF